MEQDWVKDGHFDYLVVGTGLCESMVAYLLAASDSSPTVLQLDPNCSYGQSWAAVQLDQLESTSSTPSPQPVSIRPPNCNTKSSDYAISLQPTLVPARGKFVDTLISSNVAPYLSFQLLHAFILAQPNGTLLPLPGSKHDLFRMSDLSLVDKRLLMRFFQSIIQTDNSTPPRSDQSFLEYLSQPPFSITSPRLSSMIASLSLSVTSNPTAQGVYERLKTILSAIGRHPSPTISALPAAVLLGEYGGGGDWAEGFVRGAAVTGRAVQVIGRPILSLRQPSEHHCNWSIRLGPQIKHPVSVEGEDTLEFSASKLLISQEYFSSLIQPDLITPIAYTILRGVAIVNQSGLLDKLNLEHKENNQYPTSNPSNNHALIVFPPEVGLCESPVHVLVVGSDSGSCPEGEYIIYLTTSVRNQSENQMEPSKILKPVLDKLLSNASSLPDLHQPVQNDNYACLKFEKFYSQFIFSLPEGSPTFSIHNDNKKNLVLIIPSWPIEIEKSSFLQVVESLVDQAQNLFQLATNLELTT